MAMGLNEQLYALKEVLNLCKTLAGNSSVMIEFVKCFVMQERCGFLQMEIKKDGNAAFFSLMGNG